MTGPCITVDFIESTPPPEEMVRDSETLEKALEEAFLQMAKRESERETNPPTTGTIESWLSEQADVVQRPDSVTTRSDTTSHVSYAHPCSCVRTSPR